jgi:hypothetical protein
VSRRELRGDVGMLGAARADENAAEEAARKESK